MYAVISLYTAAVPHNRSPIRANEDIHYTIADVLIIIDELCAPIVTQNINAQVNEAMYSRSAVMDKLIQELIGDRLLELNKYVKIDSLSKTIIVDKTTLTTDGYQLITH